MECLFLCAFLQSRLIKFSQQFSEVYVVILSSKIQNHLNGYLFDFFLEVSQT